MAKTRYHPELCYEQILDGDFREVAVRYTMDGGLAFVMAEETNKIKEGWVYGLTDHVVYDYVNEFVTLDSSCMVFREPKDYVRELLRCNDIGYAVYGNRTLMYSTGWRVNITNTFNDQNYNPIKAIYIMGSEEKAVEQLGDIAVLAKVLLEAHA